MKNNKGFTFVELLVVITIMAVIFSVGVVSYTTISTNSRNARRRADLEAIRQALEMCRSIDGQYPTTIYDANGGISCPESTSVITLTVTPTDPKVDTSIANCTSSQYSYVPNTTTYATYRLYAYCMEGSVSNYVVNP